MLEATRAGQSETESSGAAPRAAQPRADTGISVGELGSKRVAIDWAEALAILQALCKALCGPGGHVEAIRVDADNVFIHADGSVTITPDTRLDGVTVLQQLRHLLRGILPEEDVRPPLRSVLFHPPAGISVEAWSKSIEYYERQNRSVHIQAVYERAVNAAVRMTAAGPSSVSRPPVSGALQELRKRTPSLTSRRLLTGVAIAVTATIAATVTWVIDARLGGTQPPREISGTSVRAGSTVRRGRPALAATAHSQLASVAYSQADEDVIPAEPIDPTFLSAMPSGIDLDGFAEFEILVTEAGGVESVMARRVPDTMAEAVSMTMSSSAAKTWRFHPALKDGEPVRYRKIIWVLKS